MKKIDMSVTKRDKNLLIILISFIVGLVFFNYLIWPQLDQRSTLKAEEYSVEKQLSDAYDLIDQKTALELKEGLKKIEISKKYAIFYYDLNQGRILNQFDNLIKQSGLNVVSYIPSGSTVANISTPTSKYTYKKYPLLNYATAANQSLLSSIIDKGQATANNSSSSSSTVTEQSIPSFTLTLNFSGSSYGSLMNFIKNMEALNKAIIINKIDIHQDSTNISGQIVLTIYSMPKVDESESSELEFTPTSQYGKENPFQ